VVRGSSGSIGETDVFATGIGAFDLFLAVDAEGPVAMAASPISGEVYYVPHGPYTLFRIDQIPIDGL